MGERNLRTVDRPLPADWSDEDPMTLVEFATVFGADALHPVFPITVSGMRTEINRGRLTATFVGGSYFVTPSSVKALFKCHASPRGRGSTSAKDGSTTGAAKPSRTAGSSVTERVRSAQAAALSAWGTPNDNSPHTSRKSGTDQPPKVIPLRS